MLKLENVTKWYGTFQAVDGVSLETRPGEIFGFLGANGAGKTTTMKMIVGLLKPTSGTITVGDCSVASDPVGAKRLLGYVPDRPYLYEKLTAWEFLRFVGGLRRMDPKDCATRSEELLEIFELTDWRHEMVGAFSHGMRQRLAMASAFLHRPKLLLVDEPLVGLDPRGAHLMKQIFRRAREQGMTIFMSTHILEMAEGVCDRVAILQRGKVLAQGTLEDLQKKTQTLERSLEAIFLKLTGGKSVDELAGALKIT